ncbi:MAG: chorismate synthase [Chloroflexota bacterium]
MRDVLERASARSTAPRVAAGAVCRQLPGRRGRDRVELRRPAGIDGRSRTRTMPCGASPRAGGDAIGSTPRRCCPDPDAEAAMVAEIDSVIEAGDSIGGSFVVVAEGMPIGVGTNAGGTSSSTPRSPRRPP